jgi:hypothetical protein
MARRSSAERRAPVPARAFDEHGCDGRRDEVVPTVVGRGTYAVVGEALAVGTRYDPDQDAMIDVMNPSTGRSLDILGGACEHFGTHRHWWGCRPTTGEEG